VDPSDLLGNCAKLGVDRAAIERMLSASGFYAVADEP